MVYLPLNERIPWKIHYFDYINFNLFKSLSNYSMPSKKIYFRYFYIHHQKNATPVKAKKEAVPSSCKEIIVCLYNTEETFCNQKSYAKCLITKNKWNREYEPKFLSKFTLTFTKITACDIFHTVWDYICFSTLHTITRHWKLFWKRRTNSNERY